MYTLGNFEIILMNGAVLCVNRKTGFAILLRTDDLKGELEILRQDYNVLSNYYKEFDYLLDHITELKSIIVKYYL